jgi:phage baseplate assembly protein gpV
MATEIPSVDPVDASDFTGAFRHIFNKMLQEIDDMLPAKVISYNRATNRAVVQPLIKLLTTSNATIERAQVASVPVYQYGGGGFLLSFPIKAGDLGWIKANDRDISLFLQGYKSSAPNTIRKKSFSDAMFYPDAMRGYSISGEDINNAVLQNLSGTVKIAIFENKVKITAPIVEIDAPITHLSGDLIVDGTITAPMVIGSTDVVASGKSGAMHTHGGVQSGTSNTGVPN